MSRTFLNLCKDVVSDLGIAGGTLQSVSGALNQEQQRIINWVARADLYVQDMWADWKFLWVNDTAVTAQAGSSLLAPVIPTWAANIQSIDTQNLWQGYGTAMARRIPYMPWDQFKSLFQVKPKTPSPTPSFFSQDPTGALWLSNSVPALTAFALAYWVIGSRMTTDQSTSPIPNNFDNIICERAKILYAQRESAPEILTGSSAEFEDLLDKMQAFCLPDNTASRKLRNNTDSMPSAYVE
jgi:hypothetical protein